MHDWQITGTRKCLLGEGEEMCPAKCGKVETYMHYLVCDDPQLSKAQLCLLLTLQQQLKILNTSSGIISAFSNILRHGFDHDWQQENTFTKMMMGRREASWP